jgi:hypothetical protein
VSDQETTENPLEASVMMPRGGVAARCQRVKRDGGQCKKPARAGYRICSSHGAGYATREQAGERKKPGRPVTHGIYSTQPTRSFAECHAEVASLEDALTSSDRDLIALKSVLVMKLAELEAHAPKVQEMETTLETLTAEAERMDFDNLTPETAMNFVAQLAGVLRPVSRLSTLVSQVTDTAVKSITASKTRSETRAKLAEAEGLEVFLRLLAVQRRIVHELAADDQNHIESYEAELRRQIFAPLHLEVPELNLTPEKP